MGEINTGGPAFGQVVELRCVRVAPCGSEEYEPALAQGGMTMRDYFAAKAMQAILGGAPGGTGFGKSHQDTNLNYAVASYAIADAMLKAREAT